MIRTENVQIKFSMKKSKEVQLMYCAAKYFHQSEMAGGIFIPVFKKGKVKIWIKDRWSLKTQ